MNKKDIHELKRRLSKNGCTFTRMCGCYVDGEQNKVTTFSETFLNLEEDEFFKYLDIAKKVLSGTPGNNLLELEFPLDQEMPGGRQQFLMGLRESKLKNEELLDAFYDMVIENYSHAGNYLILLFHDVYDVMKRTKDNNDLDESEEVYEYLLGAICPVNLSKPGLGYREEENCIRSRVRDWVVAVPDTGFVFPAFTERSTDIHGALFYTRDTKNPHSEFMTEGLGCGQKLTAAEKKMTFETIVRDVIGEDNEKSDILYMDIQENLKDRADAGEEEMEPEPILLNTGTILEVLTESGLSEEQTAVIGKNYEETFGDDLPEAGSLVEPKLVEANVRRKDRLELIRQVDTLKQQLEETRAGIPTRENQEAQDENMMSVEEEGVELRLKAEKEEQVCVRMIEGRRYLVVPVEEKERIQVNGKSRESMEQSGDKEAAR